MPRIQQLLVLHRGARMNFGQLKRIGQQWNIVGGVERRLYSDDGEKDKCAPSGAAPVAEDGEGTKSPSGRVSNPAKKKLNDLLKSIVEDSGKLTSREKPKLATKDSKTFEKIGLQLAGNSRKSNIEKSLDKSEKDKKEEADTAKSEKIAKSLGPDAAESLTPEMISAVKKVAGALKGDPEVTETELVQKLRAQNAKVNMSDLFVGMKIDRSGKSGPSDTPAPPASRFGESRSQYVRKQFSEPGRQRPTFGSRPGSGSGQRPDDRDRDRDHDQSRQRRLPSQYATAGLFQSKPLGIFSAKPKLPPPQVPTLKTWDALQEKEMKFAVTHPPANGFEEMILWTETGRLWKFPLDNEQGIEGADIGFQEHVFLEPHLEPWCPKKGPIRHFMEVVCTALAKNSYLSAQEKREYIDWYHNYFQEKATIVKEVGAGTIG